MEKLKNPEPLTKENFWNGMMEKYPEAMRKFCKWVDEYKERVEWGNLFVIKPNGSNTIQYIKYHDLPLAMQIGMWAQFICEEYNQMDAAREGWAIAIDEDLKKINDALL